MKFSRNKNFSHYIDDARKKMKPGKDKNNYIGIELEILTKVPRDIVIWEIAKLGITADVGSDGSIRSNQYAPYTAEVRLLVKQSEVADMIPRIISTLKEMGAAVNKSCGLHVHLDMRNRNVKDCYKKLVEKQSVLRKLVDKNRLRNKFCRMNKATDYDTAVNGIAEEYHDHYYNERRTRITHREGHYSSINPEAYQIHKTIEVRLHEGTLDDKKIIDWVNTLVNIVDGEAD